MGAAGDVLAALEEGNQIVMRYVATDGTDVAGNPNGAENDIAGIANREGNVVGIMPHPERSFRYAQNSWRPENTGEFSGWMRLFRNARRFVG